MRDTPYTAEPLNEADMDEIVFRLERNGALSSRLGDRMRATARLAFAAPAASGRSEGPAHSVPAGDESVDLGSSR